MTVLVRGTGDIASAVAHCLFQAGYGVVMHDVSQPSATRRGMALIDAVFDGRAMLAGIEGVRLDRPASGAGNGRTGGASLVWGM